MDAPVKGHQMKFISFCSHFFLFLHTVWWPEEGSARSLYHCPGAVCCGADIARGAGSYRKGFQIASRNIEEDVFIISIRSVQSILVGCHLIILFT